MKKLLILTAVLLTSSMKAPTLKQRVKDLEKKVAELAHNEELAWKELKKMNKDVTRLEDKEFIETAPKETLMLSEEIEEEDTELE